MKLWPIWAMRCKMRLFIFIWFSYDSSLNVKRRKEERKKRKEFDIIFLFFFFAQEEKALLKWWAMNAKKTFCIKQIHWIERFRSNWNSSDKWSFLWTTSFPFFYISHILVYMVFVSVKKKKKKGTHVLNRYKKRNDFYSFINWSLFVHLVCIFESQKKKSVCIFNHSISIRHYSISGCEKWIWNVHKKCKKKQKSGKR